MVKNILILINKINPPFLENWNPFIKKYYFRIDPFLTAWQEIQLAKCTPMTSAELSATLEKAGFINVASPDYIINQALQNVD